MKIIRTRPIYLLLLVAMLCACGDDYKMQKIPAGVPILAFGDSLTRGNGAEPAESYPAVLARLSGREIINAGISGEESAAGLERLPALLTQHKPALLILCHGGNDFLRKKSVDKLEQNLRSMIALAEEDNIPVVLLGVPNLGIFLSSAEVYAKVAESSKVLFIEDVIADVLSDKSMKSDAVHPNKHGYKRMAETIFTTLQKAGAL